MIIRLWNGQHISYKTLKLQSAPHTALLLWTYLHWPDEEPGVRPEPSHCEEESEAERETEPGAGGRRGEGPRQGDRPGEVGHQQHLHQQEDAGSAQGAVQPTSVKAKKT